MEAYGTMKDGHARSRSAKASQLKIRQLLRDISHCLGLKLSPLRITFCGRLEMGFPGPGSWVVGAPEGLGLSRFLPAVPIPRELPSKSFLTLSSSTSTNFLPS